MPAMGVGVYFVLQGWGKGCRAGRGGWKGFGGVGGTRSGGGVQIVETKRLPGSKAQCSPCVTCLVYNLSHQSQLGAALPAATRLNAVNNKSPWSDQHNQVRVKTKRQDMPKQNIKHWHITKTTISKTTTNLFQLINTISSGSQPQCLLGCILSLNHQKQSTMKGSSSRFDFLFMSILQDVSLNFQHLVSLQI